jgi:RND superfamily putative drug exporter
MWWMPAWLDKRLPHLHIERPDEPPAPEAAEAERERPKVAH